MALSSQGSKIQHGTGSPTVYADVEECMSISGPSSTSNLIDVSHLGSTAKEYLQGLADNGQVQLSCNFTGGTKQMALRTMFTTGADPAEFRIRIPSAPGASTYHDFAFSAIVKDWQTKEGVDAKVELTITLQVSGAITYHEPA